MKKIIVGTTHSGYANKRNIIDAKNNKQTMKLAFAPIILFLQQSTQTARMQIIVCKNTCFLKL